MVARGLRARAILIAVIGNPDTEYRTDLGVPYHLVGWLGTCCREIGGRSIVSW